MYKLERLQSLFKKIHLTYGINEFLTSQLNYSTRIDKILIANRGEIACRIVRTAKKLGIKTVAVYSDVDRDSMHADLADEAYCIGPAPSSQSYLRQDRIIATAKTSKCQAIHPGYGFLSENTEFAELCQKENIIFIGPPAQSIRDMGIKSTSKAIMEAAGVPIIKGYHGDDQSNEILLQQARKIGFPLMIKAVRGGGGKGMRIARKEADFLQALQSARTESEKSFDDSAVLLEQYVTEPRHVEVQVFADQHGNVVYLFERDCSVQRRHQKVIEESPAPGISDELRVKLGEAAVLAAKAVNYRGAGTVEFIMDRHTQNFHFMEMNTRLQVEHPVTEAVTGTDLVEWQLRIAAGEELPLKQEDIKLNGHAFEARIYAENPRGGFLPGAGKLLHLTSPRVAENVRVETGVRENDQVSVHYDPMIAKLVVWGKDRNEALNIMKSKLSEYNIVGLETNVDFIKDICSHKKFRNGDIHTGFIEENYEALFGEIQVPKRVLAEGALGIILLAELNCLKAAVKSNDLHNPWALETGVRVNHLFSRRIEFEVEEEKCFIEVQYIEPDVYSMRVNDLGPWRTVTGALTKKGHITELKSEIDGIVEKCRIVQIANELHLFTRDRKWKLVTPRANYAKESSSQRNVATGAALSPMPGIVHKILVKKGESVKAADPLIVIIAMKMEHLIRASTDGIVEDVLCQVGQSVAKDKLLVRVNTDL